MSIKKSIFWIAGLILFLLFLFLVHPLILEGMAKYLVVRDKIGPVDMIVVLGGDNNGERMEEGVALYKQGYAKSMLLSGGPLAWNLTSADWMKKQARAEGIPESAILLEDRSRSTIENAKFSLAIFKRFKVKSIILVTSPPHSRRAKRVFRRICGKEGIKVLSFPARKSSFRISGWWKRHEDTQLVAWEYAALIYYFFKGY
jgi:uncharacterized SAM-binding protein YcdF (DUF218 family)